MTKRFGINYSMLPEHMRDSVELYIEDGVRPGSFLTAILENNFVEAAAHADETNMYNLYNWAKFLYWEAPSECWGSPEKISRWIEKGGLNGITSKARHRASSDQG